MLKYFGQVNDIKKVIKDILDEENIKFGATVFIKPNFSGRPPILGGENTSFEVLEAIVSYLVIKECRILIGHYALLALDKNKFTFDEMIKVGGYDKLLSFENVNFINLEDEEHKVVYMNELRIKIPKIIDKVDYFINVPKAKTHMETQVSLSIKNLMGLIDGLSRKIFHKFFLNNLLGYLGVHIKPNVTIIDGLVSMEGNGPHEGKNKKTNFIASGRDMVELDSFLAHLMGFDYKKIIHIRKAHELGVGDYATKGLIDKYQGEIREFAKPSEFMRFGRNIYFWPTTSCSLCHEVMRGINKKLKKDIKLGVLFYYYSWFSKKKINIIIGRCENIEYFKDDINVCIGVCTKWFAEENNIDFLMGCPPSADRVLDYIFKKFRE